MPVVLAMLVVGAIIGLWLPDVDLIFPFLTHRSVLTHSVILPLGAYLLGKQRDDRWLLSVTAGVSLGVLVHLIFDLYPAGWFGGALLYWPVMPRTIGLTNSVVWLLANCVGCIYLVLLILRRDVLWVAAAVAVVALLFAAQTERAFWQPLLTLPALAAVAICIPNPAIDGRAFIRDLWGRATATARKP
jgi:hypothetical protein